MFASNMVCEIGLVLTIQKGMTLVFNSGGIGDKFIRVYHYLNLSLLIFEMTLLTLFMGVGLI